MLVFGTEPFDLLLIMTIHKGFHVENRFIKCAVAANDYRNGTKCKACNSPQREKPSPFLNGYAAIHDREVLALCGYVSSHKLVQAGQMR